MIRVVEARAAGVADGAAAVVLEFVDADLKAQVGSQGGYQPITGVLKAGAGTITLITKMVCRRKESPDQSPVLIFSLTNGLTLDEFNAMLAHNTVGLSLPKYPVLGGYQIVLSLTLTGGGGSDTISLVTKGVNFGVPRPSGSPVGSQRLAFDPLAPARGLGHFQPADPHSAISKTFGLPLPAHESPGAF